MSKLSEEIKKKLGGRPENRNVEPLDGGKDPGDRSDRFSLPAEHRHTIMTEVGGKQVPLIEVLRKRGEKL